LHQTKSAMDAGASIGTDEEKETELARIDTLSGNDNSSAKQAVDEVKKTARPLVTLLRSAHLVMIQVQLEEYGGGGSR